MTKPTGPKQVPFWIKGLGWLAFGILSLATLLVVTRWLVTNNGHQAARRIVNLQEKKPAGRPPATLSAVDPPAAKTPGIPLSALPHFGHVLTGDRDAWEECHRQLVEIGGFLKRRETRPEHIDGLLSFRAVLQNMGVDVPETMTEEEAAGEYLKQADRFSALVARWREAVAKGPLDGSPDRTQSLQSGNARFYNIDYQISELLAMTMQARLRCGDAANAWEDWQTIHHSRARSCELDPSSDFMVGPMDSQVCGLARLGMRYGAWTDEQMARISAVAARNNPLAGMRQNQEQVKKRITAYYENFERTKEGLLTTDSQFDQVLNQVKLKLVTRQQLRDNMDVQLADADRIINQFDPDTGFYIRPPENETQQFTKTGKKGSFYFMISDFNNAGNDEDDTQEIPNEVIVSRSRNDQFQLALALETYKRKTGNYPDHLDAIDGQFAGSVPRDIATGQPYYYQRNADGYTLWGTGIDGESDGGDKDKDVTWRHRPVK
jgi:hypothetical protein